MSSADWGSQTHADKMSTVIQIPTLYKCCVQKHISECTTFQTLVNRKQRVPLPSNQAAIIIMIINIIINNKLIYNASLRARLGQSLI